MSKLFELIMLISITAMAAFLAYTIYHSEPHKFQTPLWVAMLFVFGIMLDQTLNLIVDIYMNRGKQ